MVPDARDHVPGYARRSTRHEPRGDLADSRHRGVIDAGIVAGLHAATASSLPFGLHPGCKGGLSTMDRLRARALESLVICQALLGAAIKNDTTGHRLVRRRAAGSASCSPAPAAPARTPPARPGALRAPRLARRRYNPYGTNQGWGGTEAPRGALMHQTTITNGKIQKYQCIVPTTWNGSPKDGARQPRRHRRGHDRRAVLRRAGASFKKQNDTAAVQSLRPPPVASRFCVLPSHSTRASRARSTRQRRR